MAFCNQYTNDLLEREAVHALRSIALNSKPAIISDTRYLISKDIPWLTLFVATLLSQLHLKD